MKLKKLFHWTVIAPILAWVIYFLTPSRTEADLRGQVVKFLDSVMGPNKLIERFKVMKIEQDPNQKDRVLLDIHIINRISRQKAS